MKVCEWHDMCALYILSMPKGNGQHLTVSLYP